ncbi:tape measure protein [Streptococcus anginosus]|uniref:tape measure protein n=1 Tax=Streptococcus anginosus TaxID=1328 RepID=UPI0021F8B7BC|nr:tape measure protein [Streptococcus anginosus]MCW0950254.1 tape measure protein [Streptococcus anginosus]MCW0963847.1 tape measure protein [Streptococcus anginosus]
MADGSVTIKVDMDGSSAQSGVSKLKSLFGGLESAGSKVGSVFKSVLGANLISGAISTGISTITGGIRDMASELNGSQKAWKTFEGNLQAFGRSADEIKAAKTEMQDFATKTIYSASDMASTYSQLDAVGTKNVGSLVKAFGGLAASAENPAQAMKSLSTQATQMASKPKVAWMDFKIMMEQAPAGMAAVAKEMGMSTAELVAAVQDGKVNTEDFFDAMNRAGNSDAFQKMATEFKTVDQAIDGAKESLSNKLMPAFEKLNQFGIKAVNALSDALEKINFDKLATDLGNFLDKIDVSKGIATVQKAFSTVFNPALVTKFKLALDSVKGAISAIGQAFQSAGGSTSILLTISNVIGSILNTISAGAQIVQKFMTSFADTGAVKALKGAFDSLVAAYNNVVTSIADASVWSTLGTALGNVVKWLSQAATAVADFIAGLDPGTIQNVTTAIVGIGTALLGIKAGVKIAKTLKSAFDFGKTLVSLVSNILGLTAAQAANAGASAAMSAGNTAVGTTASASAGSVMRLGAAVLMIGAGVLMAAAGVYVLVQAAMQLASAGTGAQIAMVAIVAGIALLAAGAAALGPALTAGAVGILAFGAAVALIGVGIAVAAVGISVLVTAIADGLTKIINAVSANAPQIVMIIQAMANAISTAMNGIAGIITAIGGVIATALQGIASVIISVGVSISVAAQGIGQGIATALNGVAGVISAVGSAISAALQGIANIFTSVGQAISTAAQGIGKGIESAFNGIANVINSVGNAIKGVLDGLANVFNSIGTAAQKAGNGFKQLAQGVVMITNTNLGDMAASLAAVAIGVGKISGASAGMASAGAGMRSLGQGLTMIQSSGTSAVSVLTSMASSIPSISSSITGLAPATTSASAAMSTFATSVMTSFAGLAGSTASITALQARLTALSASMMMAQAGASAMSAGFSAITGIVGALAGVLGSVPGQFMAITSSATMATAAIMQLAMSAPMVASGFSSISSAATSAMSQLNSAVRSAMTQAVSTMRSSMQQMVSVVRQSATQMTQAGQQAGRGVSNGVTNGIRSGIGSATAAMSAMVNAIRSTAMAGAGAMVGIGAMIGQGLAQGMYSALGAVTAAANALVAQAERAAQAKAKIHSPSRLFRDNVGRYIAQGIAVGIEKNTSDVTDSLAYVQREMSAFKFGAEELLGLGNSTLSSRFKLKSLTERAETSQIEVIRDQADKALTRALEVAEQAVKRPVNMVLDDGTLVAKIGEPMTNYQNDKIKIDNMMRGIV